MTASILQSRLQKLSSPKQAKILMRFFKTGPGEYGEGDRFRGIMVPVLRKTATLFDELELNEVLKVLRSPFNEDRCTALFILTMQFQKGDQKTKDQIVKAYLSSTKHINNWNLVDLSAYKILGAYLFEQDRKILYKLIRSRTMWERRIAIVSTFYFIQRKDFKDILKLSELVLKDEEDLMHKCTGWMLREVGKRDKAILISFLSKHKSKMPRTMLRYAIERFTPIERKKLMAR